MTSQIVIPLIVALAAVAWFVVASLLRRSGSGGSRLPIIGGVLALLMLVAIVVVQAAEIAITAIVAIPLLVATILQFGFLIALVSRLLRHRITQRAFTIGVLAIIAAILLGVVLMFQPATPTVFNLGFDFVLIALLAFNLWSHISPKPR